MKKLLFTLALSMVTFMGMSSCSSSCARVMTGNMTLPLTAYTLSVGNDINGIVNNTVIGVEFTQGDKLSAELLCPEEVRDFVRVKTAERHITIDISDKLTSWERNTVSRQLKGSKLYVTMPTIEQITINGASDFIATSDIRTKQLNITVNGSGKINLNGVQCNANGKPGDIRVTVNGSGDIEFYREAKARVVNIEVNGSGDIDMATVTAITVNSIVNGAGDLDIDEVETVTFNSSMTGSGDLEVGKLNATTADVSLTGTGDIKLNGTCTTASYRLTGIGDISAKNLKAVNVTAEVTTASDIECYATTALTAKVTGAGDIKYRGTPPTKNFSGKTDNIKPLK